MSELTKRYQLWKMVKDKFDDEGKPLFKLEEHNDLKTLLLAPRESVYYHITQKVDFDVTEKEVSEKKGGE